MNEDHEKTEIRTRRTPFRPAPDSDADQSVNVLPVGTHLGEFEILDLIGEGGFGIVYLAYDHSLERHVALKEYMPSGMATRTTKMAVTVRSQRHADTFTAGLKSFINEARILAQFDSPSLVKVHRFWEGNGTAYMVMPFYDGITLKQALKERRIVPSEQWIRLLLADLFDAIDTIHHAQCLHRDIAPDNILLLKDGRPLLLDFGAARRVISDLTQRLTVILKPGFAPIEQYANSAGLRQGAWTDIYALAAVVYYLIAGKAPPAAVARMVHDEMVPAREAGKGRYSAAFLAAIDKALAVRPEQRFRSIDEMRGALGIMEAEPRTMPQSSADWSTTVARTAPLAEPPPPGAPHAPRAGEDITRFDPHWQSAAGSYAGTQPRRRLTWSVLGVMLSAGIAAGVVWETQNRRDAPLEPPAVASSGSGLQSSGASGTPDADEPPAAQAAPEEAPPTPPAAQTEVPPAAPPAAAPAVVPPRASADGDADSVTPDTAPAPAQRGQEVPAAPQPPSEIELWRQASASDKAADYAAYLKQFPEGRYAALARLRYERKQNRLAAAPATAAPPSPPQVQVRPRTQPQAQAKPQAPAQPERQPKAAAVPRGEDDEGRLWSAATSLNEKRAYETYLNLYPQGRYAALAKDRLANREPPQPDVPALPPAADTPPAQPAATAPQMPRGTEQQASIKPSDAEPSPMPAPVPAPATTQRPPAPVTSGGQSLKLSDQTMTGDFAVDPQTGIVSGTGRIVWANGNRFEGTLVRGRKEGKGNFIWNNGQRYSGDWARDMPNGKGVITFANGNRYEGDVKDGLPHGQGTTRFRDGDVYSGAWVGGRSHGQGRYTWANGSYWEGEFRNDRRTDNGTMVFSEAALRAAREKAAAASGGAPMPGRAASGNDLVGK